MKYLHKDQEIFKEAIDIASYGSSINSLTAERDYYMTVFARELYLRCPFIALGGASALYKCYKVIGRVPDSLDFAVFTKADGYSGEALTESISDAAAASGLDIYECGGDALTAEESKAAENAAAVNDTGYIGIFKYRLSYNSVYGAFSKRQSFELRLELINDAEKKYISIMPAENNLLEVIRLEAPEHADEYNAYPFEICVKDMEIIFAEKIFDICDNYLKGCIRNNSADVYDIYMLLQVINTEGAFADAVAAVRKERRNISLYPSCAADIDIEELLYRIVKEEAYKQDYNDITTRLLDNTVSYDDAASAVYTAADSRAFSL